MAAHRLTDADLERWVATGLITRDQGDAILQRRKEVKKRTLQARREYHRVDRERERGAAPHVR